MTMFGFMIVLKPLFDTWTRYDPGGRLATTYTPLPLVFAEYSTPVASFNIKMSALKMAAPEESRTMPLTAPSGDCPTMGSMNRRKIMKNNPTNLTRTRPLLGGQRVQSLLRFSREASSLYRRTS